MNEFVIDIKLFLDLNETSGSNYIDVDTFKIVVNPDPIGGGPEEYRRCAQQIELGVEARLEEYVHEDLDW